MNYKKSEIKEMSIEELLATLYLLGAKEVKEVNFGRGNITNNTLKSRGWVLDEINNRIGFDLERVSKIEKIISEN